MSTEKRWRHNKKRHANCYIIVQRFKVKGSRFRGSRFGLRKVDGLVKSRHLGESRGLG